MWASGAADQERLFFFDRAERGFKKTQEFYRTLFIYELAFY